MCRFKRDERSARTSQRLLKASLPCPPPVTGDRSSLSAVERQSPRRLILLFVIAIMLLVRHRTTCFNSESVAIATFAIRHASKRCAHVTPVPVLRLAPVGHELGLVLREGLAARPEVVSWWKRRSRASVRRGSWVRTSLSAAARDDVEAQVLSGLTLARGARGGAQVRVGDRLRTLMR